MSTARFPAPGSCRCRLIAGEILRPGPYLRRCSSQGRSYGVRWARVGGRACDRKPSVERDPRWPVSRSLVSRSRPLPARLPHRADLPVKRTRPRQRAALPKQMPAPEFQVQPCQIFTGLAALLFLLRGRSMHQGVGSFLKRSTASRKALLKSPTGFPAARARAIRSRISVTSFDEDKLSPLLAG